MKGTVKKAITNWDNGNIHFGSDSLFGLQHVLKKQFKGHLKFIIVDENTYQHCLPTLLSYCPELTSATIIKIKSGEQNKTLQTAELIWKQLTISNAGRQSVLINLGGGVVTDIGSFCASTFKRGLVFCNVPTTLIGMTDAAIGGKTAIDFYDIKNLLGTFSNPGAIYIYPGFLNTLDLRNLISGKAEMIKHALIADCKWWKQMQELPFEELHNSNNLKKSINVKCRIVKNDPFETSNRKLLNFGHTVGHAVEAWSIKSNKPLLHGECVAIGMVMETYLSHLKCRLSKSDVREITEYIDANYLLPKFKANEITAIIRYMMHDKKNTQKGINFTLLASTGTGIIDRYCDPKMIQAAFQFYNSVAE